MGGTSGGLLEEGGKLFSRAMQFTAHRVGGLAGQQGDFVVAEFLVSDEQEQETIFLGQRIERFLDALTKLLGLEDAQGTLSGTRRAFPNGFVIGAVNVPAVPGLEQVLAVMMNPFGNARLVPLRVPCASSKPRSLVSASRKRWMRCPRNIVSCSCSSLTRNSATTKSPC